LTSGWITLFMGDIGEGAYTKKKENNCQIKTIKICVHQDELADRLSVAI
jgi:hypothetical protein